MKPLTYGSVCSGIESASVAWEPLGWKPAFFSQFDPEHDYSRGPDFPSRVLAHRFPHVPNYGDMTRFEEWPDHAIDVLVGGTPCQAFSIAGLREGLGDARGNLMLVYGAIARRFKPAYFIWENVPGVFSSDEGRDFGSFLALMSGRRIIVPAGGWRNSGIVEGIEGAYGLAWVVRDSQYCRVDGFGRAVPQRRRRVFVVGYLGDWRRSAAILFERESLHGNSAPRRQARQDVAGTVAGGARKRGGHSLDDIPVAASLTASDGGLSGKDGIDGRLVPAVANPLTARMNKGVNTTMDEGQTMVAHSLRAEGFDASEDGTGRGTPLVPIAFNARQDPVPSEGHTGPLDTDPLTQCIAFSSKDHGADAADQVAPTLRAGGHTESHANAGAPPAVAFQPRFTRNGRGAPDEIASALTAEAGRTGKGDSAQCVAAHGIGHNGGPVWKVRRLTPRECERLQALPDDWTLIDVRGKPAADGPRYKALGNAMSANVIRWIGRRIDLVRSVMGDA